MDGDKAFVIFILVGLIISIIPALVASSKGREFFLWYIYGLCLFPFALIHAIVIKPNELANGMTKCRSCASVISEEAKICPSCRTILDGSEVEAIKTTASRKQKQSDFEGERDISSSSYQLFLTREYEIEKNATLEKYVIGNDVFTTLEESLREADRRYRRKLSDALEKEESDRRELTLTIENAAIEREERSNQEARIRQEELEREAKMAPVRAKKIRRLKFIVGGVALCVAIIGLGYEIIKSYVDSKENKRKDSQLSAILKMYSSSTFFGFELGKNSLLTLRGMIPDTQSTSNSIDKNGTKEIVCSGKACSSFVLNNDLSNRINAIYFYYCISSNGGIDIISKAKPEDYILTEVALDVDDKTGQINDLIHESNFLADWAKSSAVHELTWRHNAIGLRRMLIRGGSEKLGDACGNPS